MTDRAKHIWNEFCGELIAPPTEDMREALATAIHECANRLCTDWAELQHPSDVLEEIANEIDAL
jgi:hypothetical protein